MVDSKEKMKIPDRAAKITEVITKLNEMTLEENRMAPDDIKKFTDEVLRRETAFYKAEDIHRLDDYMFLPPFFPDTIKEGYDDWEPGKGVVLLSTFPKTGTVYSGYSELPRDRENWFTITGVHYNRSYL